MEQSEVETEVGLCGSLPLQVVVTQTGTTETAGQLLATVRTLDVIAGTIALSAKLCLAVVALIERVAGNDGNLLVTGLTP